MSHLLRNLGVGAGLAVVSIALADNFFSGNENSMLVVRSIEFESPESRQQLFNSLEPPFAETYASSGDPVTLKTTIAPPSQKETTAVGRYDAYSVTVKKNSVHIIADNKAAALYAADWLANELAKNRGQLAVGTHADSAVHSIRALHLVVRKVTPQQLRHYIEQARQARLNTLILHLADGVDLELPAVTARADAISLNDFSLLLDFARDNGLAVIPQVALLTHQEKFFGRSHADLMWNSVTYDPTNEAVYPLVFEYLEKVISLFATSRVHIGHDEVAGLTEASAAKWLKADEKPLPSSLYLQHLRRIHAFLSERNIETWMWGDMLLAPADFPRMKPETLNGHRDYRDIREQIPADIVVCDWRYFDASGNFDTIDAFSRQQNPVVGATWKNRRNIRLFSRHVANMPDNARGMIATTWFHVQRDEQAFVDELIEFSGEQFWAPDGRS